MADRNETGYDRIYLARANEQELIDNKDKIRSNELVIAKDSHRAFHKGEDGTLNKIVSNYTFDTIADLQSTDYLVEGDIVELLGYYEKGDGTGHKRIISTASDESGVSVGSLFANLIVEKSINVKYLGAKGDGTNDDTIPIQSSINLAYDLGASVFIGEGTFRITSTLRTPMGSHYSRKGTVIEGVNEQATIIKYDISSTSNMIETFLGETEESNVSGYNLVIKALSLTTTNRDLCDTVISIENKSSGVILDRLDVRGGITGIEFKKSAWINSMSNIKITTRDYGLITGTDGTTLNITNIYVYGTTKTAYIIRGTYSHIGCLAADNCSGDSVYNFSYFSGSVGALGCEGANVTEVLNLSTSSLAINSLFIFHPLIDDVNSKGQPMHIHGSTVSIDTFSIRSDVAVSAQPYFTAYHGSLNIKHLDSAVDYQGDTGRIDDNDSFFNSSSNSSGIGVRSGGAGRAYLGVDRIVHGETVDMTKAQSPAIFLDSLGNPRYRADGHDERWRIGATVGDWFIESRPDLNNCAGYVCTLTAPTFNSSTRAKQIPIVLSGNTPSRPTEGLYLGLQYYDSTLKKPIWWDGTYWKDAIGATV